jgi:hypothetical protein
MTVRLAQTSSVRGNIQGEIYANQSFTKKIEQKGAEDFDNSIICNHYNRNHCSAIHSHNNPA